jgi:UDPglucose 6-dehydrogenase
MSRLRHASAEATAPARVAVVGAGYVGLVTAAGLASLGHRVTAVDKDASRIRSLRTGSVPIMEPGLAELLLSGRACGLLAFETNAAVAAAGSDMVIVAVGTLDGDGAWSGQDVVDLVGSLLESGSLPRTLVVRSTLQPGYSKRLRALIAASGQRIDLLLHPEFTRQGRAIHDFLRPERIVIGVPPGADPAIAEPLVRLYCRLRAPVLVVDHPTAEMIKIASNAFLALKVSFANELAWFCRAVGADMAQVRHGVGLDSRIGHAYLQPGPGIGGSCLPNQIELLARTVAESGIEATVINAVASAARRQPTRVAEEIVAIPSVRRVAVLGLAFKARTDDLRGSPAIALLRSLRARGVPELAAYDPTVSAVPSLPWLRVAGDPYGAADGADVVVVATEWPEFASLDWARLRDVMNGREIFDARGVVPTEAARLAGFRIHSLERRTVDGLVPDDVAASSAA